MRFLLGWNGLYWLYIFWSSYLNNQHCFSSLIDTGMIHLCKVPCCCTHSLRYSRNLWKKRVIGFMFWIVVMHNQQNAECWLKNLINQICKWTEFKLIALLSMILHITGPPERILTCWGQIFPKLTLYSPPTTLPPYAV